MIKIRYDIIEAAKGQELKADEIFDHYDDVIDLDLKTDMVQSGTPVKTCVYNRLCYVIKNQNSFPQGK